MYILRDNIFTNIYAFHAQGKLRRKLAELQQKGANLVIPDNDELALEAFNTELKAYQDTVNDRKKIIDDKAKSSLFVITLSITVILAGLNFIKDGKMTFRLPLLILVILGVVYFVLSGITAVRALNVREFYTLHPDDWIENKEDQPTVISLEKQARTKSLYAAIKANELVLNIRSNFVHATLIGIRNGIILLSFAFIIAVGNIGNQVRFNDSPKNEHSASSSSDSNSEQAQPKTSPVQGASRQESTTQPGAGVPKDLSNPNNEQNVNNPESDSAKRPMADVKKAGNKK